MVGYLDKKQKKQYIEIQWVRSHIITKSGTQILLLQISYWAKQRKKYDQFGRLTVVQEIQLTLLP